MKANQKKDAQEVLEALERHNVDHFLHYTPAVNVEAILTSGNLYSRRTQRSLGISPATVHGWGDKWLRLDDSICLCFVPPLGLLRREKR